MNHSLVPLEDPKPTSYSKLFFPRCVCILLVSGLLFYSIYSVLPPLDAPSTYAESKVPCQCEGGPVDEDRLFYNRVPKCGSTTLINLMRRLALRNGYAHYHSKVYDRKNVTRSEQRRIVEEISESPRPSSFDRHVFFINFTRFGVRSPLFMNVIRDPVERIISSFFYRRMVARQNRTNIRPSNYWLNKKFEHCVLTPDPECTFLDGQHYSVLQLPYFCGQDAMCQSLNNPEALALAKRNIEEHFSVVGILEDMNTTLRVLEETIPRFFKGAREVYNEMSVHFNQNSHKELVREEIKEILRANLTAEYELYRFVKERLRRQDRLLWDTLE